MNAFKEKLKKNQKLVSVYGRLKMEMEPWGFIGSYIVFPIQRFIRLHVYCPEKYKKIEKLRDLHKGERCFILATGPSLKWEDIELLKNEYTIGMNNLYKLCEEKDWKPSLYTLTDPTLYANLYNKENFRNPGQYSKEYSIINALNEKMVDNDEKVIFIHDCWLDHCYRYGISEKFKYDEKPIGGIYDYYSMTQECIYYALFMGFKEIYLLGADNDYLGNKQHFIDIKGVGKISYEHAVKSQRANDLAYAYMKKIADSKGVKIYNATRGGKVKCFPRVKLEDIV